VIVVDVADFVVAADCQLMPDHLAAVAARYLVTAAIQS